MIDPNDRARWAGHANVTLEADAADVTGDDITALAERLLAALAAIEEAEEAAHEATRAAERQTARLEDRLGAVIALCGGPMSDGYKPLAVDLDGEVTFAVDLDVLRAAAGVPL